MWHIQWRKDDEGWVATFVIRVKGLMYTSQTRVKNEKREIEKTIAQFAFIAHEILKESK